MRLFSFIAILFLISCNGLKKKAPTTTIPSNSVSLSEKHGHKEAIFGAGCFWCVEGIFETIEGVEDVVSGFSGGTEKEAKYKIVGTGKSNHAEVVKITYNPAVIKYECLLKILFESHDPTTLNKQGPDVGTEYRSVIFYQNETEKNIAENYIKELTDAKVFDAPIVTTLEEFTGFYPAEDYHQDFKKRNEKNPYVLSVSVPRLKKFKAKFKGCEE